MSDNSVKNSALAAVRAAKEKQNAQKGGEVPPPPLPSPAALSELIKDNAASETPTTNHEKVDCRHMLEHPLVKRQLKENSEAILTKLNKLIRQLNSGHLKTKEPERESAPAVEDILKKQR